MTVKELTDILQTSYAPDEKIEIVMLKNFEKPHKFVAREDFVTHCAFCGFKKTDELHSKFSED